MVTMEKLEGLKVRLTFEIPADEFDEYVERAYHKTARYYNMPGFRKGKAPRKVIENAFGEKVFFEDAFEMLFPEKYSDALRQYQLKTSRDPELEDLKMEKGQPLTFVIVLETPVVTLGEYKGIEVSRAEYNVTDEQIEEALNAKIDREKEAQVRMVSVERPVENGDIVEIDYSGSVDGVKFEGGTAEHQRLEIGSHMFIAGFEEQLIGMTIGEERDINVTFPEEYHAPDLSGKPAVFAIKLHSITKKEYPELDDEFAKEVSEFDTFEEYKASLRAEAEKELREHAEHHLENDVLTKAVENATIEYPEGFIDSEVQHQIRHMLGDRMTLQDFCRMTGYDYDEYMSYMTMRTQASVAAELFLKAVAEAEGIEPTEEELREFAVDMLKKSSQPIPEDQFETVLSEILSDKQRSDLVYEYRLEKAKELVLQAKVLTD